MQELRDFVGSSELSSERRAYFLSQLGRLKTLKSCPALHTLCCEYACRVSEELDCELPAHLHARMLLGAKCFWTEEYIFRRG